MKIKTKIYIYYIKYIWDEKGEYQVFSVELPDEEYRTYIGEQEIEIEVLDNYDPRPQQIAVLEEQKKKAMAKFQKTMDEINERISKLQAITYDTP